MSVPSIARWAAQLQAEGHPILPETIAAFDVAVGELNVCMRQLEMSRGESSGEAADDLPSMDDLERRLAAGAPTTLRKARANATKLFGRAQL